LKIRLHVLCTVYLLELNNSCDLSIIVMLVTIMMMIACTSWYIKYDPVLSKKKTQQTQVEETAKSS